MTTDPRRLAVLLAVHRAGGVLAAADLLRVTPSAVSQQIARLEAEEGVPVLDRGPRGATLTPAGRILADAAERIEAELVEARKQLATLGGELSGRVTVAGFQTAIRAVVTPALADLAEHHPGVELVVEEREPADALRRLREGDADVVLIERDEDADGHTPRGQRDVVLLEEPWRVVLPPAVAVPAQLSDLAGATWVAAEPGTAAARALARVASMVGPLTTRHVYYDFDVALALVAAGQGVGMLPALALQGELPDGVTVTTVPGLGSRRLVARHRATRHEPRPTVTAVLDELMAVAAGLDLV
ncbi:LysR family transcriptional regulator [Cellulomonas oligotrophica]|uniref:DNA-binding transcriptional LysR family regulator n=1 Tax=Cellulomonas oligotrophica TaxID=931536 RepID=A0A7Y9FFD0_9CELL|nr:LysR family transcriptional regulator [Cellulomonas oligotrophica]NYD86275.1 DNA-binding transcriptional LysR family regulator [Cellulomonas oligotrophica]GIG34399.1 LysR family transcriptional regulator [Cellulomonas oligotrophica]